MSRSQNWIFLGDSLTEGVGTCRVSYVTELARRLREHPGEAHGSNVHVMRLCQVAPEGLSQFVSFNLAGHWDDPSRSDTPALWLWNLACEGRTIDTDKSWLPFIENLRPEIVFVFRGSLESIVRPATLRHGCWPTWVPQSWRGYAAMDPRCYFSTTWWRRLKQTGLNALRQCVRHSLLRSEAGHPLMDSEALIARYAELLERLREISTRVIVLGLLPIDPAHFPGSPEQFQHVNARLRLVAARSQVEFVDWQSGFGGTVPIQRLFYLDGFHPNQLGAGVLADMLRERLVTHGTECGTYSAWSKPLNYTVEGAS
jgi:hypothetical protein